MIRHIFRNINLMSNRKQNFFELNPIYPDYSEKNFDIYNVERERVSSLDLHLKNMDRSKKVKKMLRDQFYLRKYKLKQIRKEVDDAELDEETGLPMGVNVKYDAFIADYKKNSKKTAKTENQFKELLLSLIKKFEVKSEVELIKLFRISLAHCKKDSFKEQLRGRILQEAVAKASMQKSDYFEDFFSEEELKSEETADVDENELEEAAFLEALKQVDTKIAESERQVKAQKGGHLDKWDDEYGPMVEQEAEENQNYDANLKRGYVSMRGQRGRVADPGSQDEYIRSRINRLFFMRKLEHLKKETPFKFDMKELPVELGKRQNLINSLAHRYKEEELLAEPSLNEIYQEIDTALSKVYVRFTADRVNEKESKENFARSGKGDEGFKVTERQVANEDLLWENLDIENVYSADYYQESVVSRETIEEKDLLHVSPSADTEISLARSPFNLYRHSECEIFNIFTKYKHMVSGDYLDDKQIDVPTFNYFSLEEAKNTLKRIKKQDSKEIDKFYGHSKRKKSEAEVYLQPGTGIVTVNGKSIRDYFVDTYHRVEALKPLIFTETAGQYDLQINVIGGGIHGQSECVAHALAQAFMKINPQYISIFEKCGLDKTDYRQKEPKRMGLYSARVRPPYVRR